MDGYQDRVTSSFVQTELRGEPIEFRIDTGSVTSRGGTPVQGVLSIGVTLPDGREFSLTREGRLVNLPDETPVNDARDRSRVLSLFQNQDFMRQLVERAQHDTGMQATTLDRRIDAMMRRALASRPPPAPGRSFNA